MSKYNDEKCDSSRQDVGSYGAAIDQITKVVANVNTIIGKVTKEISTFKI